MNRNWNAVDLPFVGSRVPQKSVVQLQIRDDCPLDRDLPTEVFMLEGGGCAVFSHGIYDFYPCWEAFVRETGATLEDYIPEKQADHERPTLNVTLILAIRAAGGKFFIQGPKGEVDFTGYETC